MREWGAMHPALRALLVGVLTCGVVLAAGLIGGSSLDDAIANAVFYALVFGGGVFFATKRFQQPAGTLDENGQVMMFLRYPNAAPGSLGGIWQKGIASAASGRIDFQPAVNDELIPSGRSKTLTGLTVLALPRKPGHHDIQQGVPFGFQIITMESDKGIIDIAASPGTLQKIQEGLGHPGS